MAKYKVQGYVVEQDGENVYFKKNGITLARLKYVGKLTEETAEEMVIDVKRYLLNVEQINEKKREEM